MWDSRDTAFPSVGTWYLSLQVQAWSGVALSWRDVKARLTRRVRAEDPTEPHPQQAGNLLVCYKGKQPAPWGGVGQWQQSDVSGPGEEIICNMKSF